MTTRAFAPAHLTGFFTAKEGRCAEETGSLGAGFSIRDGVSTSVDVDSNRDGGHIIRITGYSSPDTRVSERIIGEYRALHARGFFRIHHEISVPVGYGFGCSAAAALSLSMALNAALGSPLGAEAAAGIAHKAEVECRTGLGDVLAAYHGGFEMRLRAGAPGIGRVENIDGGEKVVIACFAPISTEKFMTESMGKINGLGSKMLSRLAESRDRLADFQDMSLEFAERIGVMTPDMQGAVDALHGAGIRCGVALFGQTVFAMVDSPEETMAVRTLESLHGCQTIRSSIDKDGARLQAVAPVIVSE